MTETDREAREDLERVRRLDALSEVVGRFSHDFSNLLATISLNLGLIEKHCSDPTALWFVASALRATDRGGDLANRLRAFSGKQKLSRVPADLQVLLGEMRESVSRAAGPAIDVVARGTPELWPALVDRDQLEFALQNVTENARDAMPGGGTLKVEMANVRTAEPMPDLAAGEYVVVALEDTGDGLSEQVIERAFEPFFSTRGSRDHPGLGLSTVMGVARAHGGSARIKRAAGGGCRIEIYLPRASEADARAAEDPDAGPPGAREPGKATVLVVDDDPDLRLVAEEGLIGLGYDVLVADGGAAALEILASRPAVDLLIVDMTMAGMNGLELVRRAREMRPGLNALIMTGAGQIPGRGDGGDAPPILKKPFRIADLAQAVAAAMAGSLTQ